jgi:hypothetical protein
LLGGKSAFFKALGEGFAFEAFHDEVVDAVLMPDVVKHADVWMIQRGDGSCFALESLLRDWVGSELRRKNFNGDGSIEARVFGTVDFAHATGSQRGDDFIGTKLGAGNERHKLGDYTPEGLPVSQSKG